MKRTATAEGRPTVGRKRGAKPRADEQEPDRRRRRAGRAGVRPRSSDDQGSGDVDPAVVRRRTAVLPGEMPSHAWEGDPADGRTYRFLVFTTGVGLKC